MTIRVEIQGRGQVAEFPDGTPQDVIDAAVKRDYFSGSTADTARQRLESRGVNPDVPVDPDKNRGPGFGRGLWDSIVPSKESAKRMFQMTNIYNPIGQWKAAGKTGMDILNSHIDQSKKARESYGSAWENFRSGNLRKGTGEAIEGMGHATAAGIPLIGPPAAQAGEEIKEGNIGYGLGKATGLIAQSLIPGGVKAKGENLAAKAPVKIAAAESKYAKALGTKNAGVADEMVPKMMDQNTIVSDPAKLADKADQAAAAIDVEALIPPGQKIPAQPILERIRAAQDAEFHTVPPDVSALVDQAGDAQAAARSATASPFESQLRDTFGAPASGVTPQTRVGRASSSDLPSWEDEPRTAIRTRDGKVYRAPDGFHHADLHERLFEEGKTDVTPGAPAADMTGWTWKDKFVDLNDVQAADGSIVAAFKNKYGGQQPQPSNPATPQPKTVPKSPESDAIVSSLEEYADLIRQHADESGMIDARQALELRRRWETRPGERGFYDNPDKSVPDNMQVRMEAAGAIRPELNAIPEVGPANAEKSFQLKMKGIAENMPKSAKTPGRVLWSGAKKIGYGLGAAHIPFPGAEYIGGGAAVYGLFEIIRDLPKTPAWQTATAVQKRNFYKAVESGDLTKAAEIGARIAAGQSVSDDYLQGLMQQKQ